MPAKPFPAVEAYPVWQFGVYTHATRAGHDGFGKPPTKFRQKMRLFASRQCQMPPPVRIIRLGKVHPQMHTT